MVPFPPHSPTPLHVCQQYQIFLKATFSATITAWAKSKIKYFFLQITVYCSAYKIWKAWNFNGCKLPKLALENFKIENDYSVNPKDVTVLLDLTLVWE